MKNGGVSQKVELRNLRLEMGLTQQELADSLGMNSRYISMVESGLKPCSDKMLKKVELLVRTKHLSRPPASVHTEDCPQCVVKDKEIVWLKEQLSKALDALAVKPTPAAGPVCSASGGGHEERRGA